MKKKLALVVSVICLAIMFVRPDGASAWGDNTPTPGCGNPTICDMQ